MKQADLVRKLESMGCVLVRHGGKHDFYHNPRTNKSQPVPRHREINEHLARSLFEGSLMTLHKSLSCQPS